MNHPFVRWHANNEVRERSQAVVRSWKELVRTADGYEPSQPSGDSRKRKTPTKNAAVGPTKRRARAQPPAAESSAPQEGTASSSSSGAPKAQASASGDHAEASGGATPLQPPAGPACEAPPPAEGGPERCPDGQPPASPGSSAGGPPTAAQLARLTVKQLKSRLEQLRVDHAGCIEKSDLVSLLLATSCEAGIGSEPATPPQKRRASWSPQWTVPQLKAKMKEMGMSTGGCTEKADLIAALRRAAAPLRRSGPGASPTPGAAEASPTKTQRAAAPSPARTPASSPKCGSFAKRISMGRKSLLRSKTAQRATTPEAKERASGQRKEPGTAKALHRQVARGPRLLSSGCFVTRLDLRQRTLRVTGVSTLPPPLPQPRHPTPPRRCAASRRPPTTWASSA